MACRTSKVLRTETDPKAGPQTDSLFVSAKVGAQADGYFGVMKRKVDGDSTVYTVPFQSVQRVTTGNQTITLTAEQNGQTVVLASTDPIVVQLPDAKVGLKFNVFIEEIDNAHAISPQASDGIAAVGLTAVVDKDLINSTSTAYAWAQLEAVSDSLWIARINGTWTKQS